MAAVPTEQATHTQGPWSVCYDHPDDECRESIAYIRPSAPVDGFWEANEIATVYACDGSDERKANVRLLAAAPELLEALYAALPFVEDLQQDDGYKPGYVAATLATLRAAIAKAEGAAS